MSQIIEQNAPGVNTKAIILFGVLGGLTTSMVSLVTVDAKFLIERATLVVIAGYTIRLIILGFLGALLAYFNKNGIKSIIAAYQIGISGPALITSTLTNVSENRPISSVDDLYRQTQYPLQTVFRYVVDNGSPSAGGSIGRELTRGLGIGTDAFPLVFSCVLGMTMFSAIVSVYLASRGADTQRVNSLIETYSTTWKLGFGAIIGLLSGKALG
jgi:hypothetical protein